MANCEWRTAFSPHDLLRLLYLLADLASEDVPEHDEIGDQAQSGIGKGGRLVLFEKEVAYPRKAIATDGHQGDQPARTNEHPKKEEGDQSRRADEVQGPAGGILMFCEVVWVKLLEGGVFLFHDKQIGASMYGI